MNIVAGTYCVCSNARVLGHSIDSIPARAFEGIRRQKKTLPSRIAFQKHPCPFFAAKITMLRLFIFLGLCWTSLAASSCQVPGGTADDGPAIKAALASCNNGGTVILDNSYTLTTVLQTNNLNNVAIDFTGSIKLNPGKFCHLSAS